MFAMSASRSGPRSGTKVPPGPRAALDALLAGPGANPLRRALWLDALDLQLRPRLPDGTAAHARLANVDGAKLVFVVDSPVWRARLRLAAPELLEAARSIGLDVGEVIVKVTTQPLRPDVPAQRASLPMSATAREALQAALASLAPPGKGEDDGS